MGTIGHRVQEQIGKRVAREMFWIALSWRENDARASNAFALRVITEAVLRSLGRIEQPQDALRNARENLHPAIECEARYLLCSVEAAEYEGVFGQSGLGARWALGDQALAVVRLIAGQAQDLLGIVDF